MRRLVGALVLLGLLAVAGCSAGAGTADQGEQTASLSVGLVAEPANLDFTTTDGAAIPQALLYNVYETLVKVDGEGELVPSLARSWEVSEDRRTYTFELVEGATFTDGAPFTAEDAVFSIERVQTEWTTSLAAAMDVVESATAVSPTTLRVELSRPSNDWLYRMTTRIGAMFSRTGVDALGTDPVGTGPYRFGSWNRGDSITLLRNDGYWGSAPQFGEVVLRYFRDPTALNNALLSGTIDVIGTVQAPESLEQFTSDPRFQVIEGTTTAEVVLSFNRSRAPLDDLDVRRAIKHAIDHRALVDTCWAGRGTLIGSMVPPSDPWYTDLTGRYPYDPDRARELLEGTDATSSTLRLRVPNLPYAVACGQVVESQLEQVGLDVQMDTLEFPAAWLQTVYTDADYDMSIIAHVEPRDLRAVFGDPDYYTRYGEPEFVEHLDAADAGTEAEQTEQLRLAAEMLADDAAADWLFLLPNLVVAEQGITGLPQNAVSESFDLSALGRS
ncbi:ABC transporter substrate-binding protein [Auraticoccus sp. F435]|uniref:ABC transporter substrate-binding protein n=1 Tax=Auraticoccus cholistanensis TaxID=2656650 RepID=A0A6A9V0V6_9ACTN|nr:ABC transporter substrate-binding protein [Auraticoccus cholistanensis]